MKNTGQACNKSGCASNVYKITLGSCEEVNTSVLEDIGRVHNNISIGGWQEKRLHARTTCIGHC